MSKHNKNKRPNKKTTFSSIEAALHIAWGVLPDQSMNYHALLDDLAAGKWPPGMSEKFQAAVRHVDPELAAMADFVSTLEFV